MEILLNNNIYYILDDIRELYPNVFNSNEPSRKLISSLNITDSDYLYAYLKNDTWVISSSKYTGSKLLISKNWITNNLNMSFSPDIFTFPEKITVDNNTLDITIISIGPITLDTALFRFYDVIKAYGIGHFFGKTMILKMKENIEYKYITINDNKKFIYLTYIGLIKTTLNKKGPEYTANMQRWLIDKLHISKNYAIRNLSVNNTVGYSDIICNIFSKFEFSCIYLLNIGTYVDKNTGQEYTDVYKFGRSIDFNRRYKEHNKNYKTTCIICTIQYIDPELLSNAETDVKNYMTDINAMLNCSEQDELVQLKEKQIKSVINQYKIIGQLYSFKMNKFQREIVDLHHQLELNKEKYNNELLLKDIEILKLENKLIHQKENYSI